MSGAAAAPALAVPPSARLGSDGAGGRRPPIRAVLGRGGLYVALPVAVLALWQGLYALGLIRPVLLPPPTRVAETFWVLTVSGELPHHLVVSMRRVLEGFAIAAFLALPLGVAIGMVRLVDHVTDLLIQLVKPIPPIAWIPLAILWFGIGEEPKIFIIALGAFFPILINTVDGIRQTDHRHVELARVLEVPRWKFVARVVLPGALPGIMTGLRVGLMVGWICVVAAELIAASSGVGYLIMDARQLSQTDAVLVGMITIGAMGKLLDALLRSVERRLIGWRSEFTGS